MTKVNIRHRGCNENSEIKFSYELMKRLAAFFVVWSILSLISVAVIHEVSVQTKAWSRRKGPACSTVSSIRGGCPLVAAVTSGDRS